MDLRTNIRRQSLDHSRLRVGNSVKFRRTLRFEQCPAFMFLLLAIPHACVPHRGIRTSQQIYVLSSRTLLGTQIHVKLCACLRHVISRHSRKVHWWTPGLWHPTLSMGSSWWKWSFDIPYGTSECWLNMSSSEVSQINASLCLPPTMPEAVDHPLLTLRLSAHGPVGPLCQIRIDNLPRLQRVKTDRRVTHGGRWPASPYKHTGSMYV